MTERFHIPGRFTPTRSLLARLVAGRIADRERRRTLFYVWAVGVSTLWLVGVFLGWAWLHLEGDPSPAALQAYGALQALGLLGLALAVWMGHAPAVRIEVREATLLVTERQQEHRLRLEDVSEVIRIPADVYQRHYRRFAGAQAWIRAPRKTLVLLRSEHGAFVLGVREAEQDLLVDRVREGMRTHASAQRVA